MEVDFILNKFDNNKEKVIYLINNNRNNEIFNLEIDYSKINFIDRIFYR
jgi:hypothetical protein